MHSTDLQVLKLLPNLCHPNFDVIDLPKHITTDGLVMRVYLKFEVSDRLRNEILDDWFERRARQSLNPKVQRFHGSKMKNLRDRVEKNIMQTGLIYQSPESMRNDAWVLSILEELPNKACNKNSNSAYAQSRAHLKWELPRRKEVSTMHGFYRKCQISS